MGSTGSGRLRDYPKRHAKKKSRKGGGGGGGSEDDRCKEPIGGVELENVERCTYYRNHGAVPPQGTDIALLNRLADGRLAIVIGATRETVGHLPTRLNYLQSCLSQHSYEGEVTASSMGRIARVTIDLRPAP